MTISLPHVIMEMTQEAVKNYDGHEILHQKLLKFHEARAHRTRKF